ncbi:aromatic amino acid aminotransferase [Serratia marcescens]|uniref:hypothetical protein n=1 Tax=Serratia TaxID=613 RepID=UPI000645245F|nr:hypothetical protein [Serratia marcescens]ALE96863.1 hypothetical protein ABH11_02537 [Serratia marcescens]MCF1217224.1 hypothetical protein [Serratia marcescens]MCF1319748.1 hypothetical protein [Serratia marcescens]MCF1324502.1 hypothetical protein [Serratia marcescens]MDV5426387.1 hypothetical protein [Serratia marcescens]
MFKQIAPSAADSVPSLMGVYLQDPNPQKVNLGIGLYYDRQNDFRPAACACRGSTPAILTT